jgi:MoaA/NifB/PqqE/SkfB family radical SAM enzyme
VKLRALPTTLVVLWRITESCNLGCAFCAYDRALRRARHATDAQTVDGFGEVLAEYQRTTGVRVLVSWLGGEPLLWAPLAGVSEKYHSQHGLDLSLTTNGTRLDRSAVRTLLIRHYSEVTLSVDGFQPYHDAMRGRAGLFDALARSISQLAAEKRAAGSGPLLRVNVVLMRGNVGTFAPLCRELAGWGIEEISFNQLGGNDRPEFFPHNRLLPEQADEFAVRLPGLQMELAARGVTLRGSSEYLRRIAASSRDSRLSPADCAPGRDFLFIDERGRIAPCSFTTGDYGMPLAEMTGAGALMTLPARFAAQRRSRSARGCADCHSTQHFGKFAVHAP